MKTEKPEYFQLRPETEKAYGYSHAVRIGNDIKIMRIELSHVIKIEKLPLYHRDPFDRLIISQVMAEDIPIISSDDKFDSYPVKRMW